MYVVCEQVSAIVYHIRLGKWEKCGKQDTLALCNIKPAWDTQIPIPDPIRVLGNKESGWCNDCMTKLADQEEMDI